VARDEDVEGPEGLLGLRQEALGLPVAGKIASQGDCRGPGAFDLGDDLPRRLLVAGIGHGDACPEAPEERAHGPADAAAAPGHERGPAGQGEHGGKLPAARGHVKAVRPGGRHGSGW
jgi:hypothetical protein